MLAALLATASLAGCYVSHERGRDGAVPPGDARRPPGAPCAADAPVITLDRVATGLGDPACRTLEVRGGRSIVCAGLDVDPFRIEGAGAGTLLLVHVTVLNEPPLIPGSPYRVGLRSFYPETCDCMGGGWAETDASRTHTWMTGSPALEIGLANEDALYRIEACSTAAPTTEDDGRIDG
jgi:hypothetical protein